jgi:hypothetical protein
VNDSERGRAVSLEVFQEYPLKFEGHLLSCAKIAPAKERNPNGNIETRMLNNTESSAQRMRSQKAGS